jgi:hypothetical protein
MLLLAARRFLDPSSALLALTAALLVELPRHPLFEIGDTAVTGHVSFLGWGFGYEVFSVLSFGQRDAGLAGAACRLVHAHALGGALLALMAAPWPDVRRAAAWGAAWMTALGTLLTALLLVGFRSEDLLPVSRAWIGCAVLLPLLPVGAALAAGWAATASRGSPRGGSR